MTHDVLMDIINHTDATQLVEHLSVHGLTGEALIYCRRCVELNTDACLILLIQHCNNQELNNGVLSMCAAQGNTHSSKQKSSRKKI